MAKNEHEQVDGASEHHSEVRTDESAAQPEDSEHTHQEHETQHADNPNEAAAKSHKLKRVWHWAVTHKKIAIPAATVFVLAILAAVPFTRYALAGVVVDHAYQVQVIDAETERPVSNATVHVGGAQMITDAQGNAEIRASVGRKDLTVTKLYYEDHTERVLIPLAGPDQHTVALRATGRTVPVTVLHNITQQPIADVTLEAADAEVTTDEEGKAIIVVPADEDEVPVTLSGRGFNTSEATLQVTAQEVPENTFGLTPEGKIYFLSNRSGNIDVVKTNLDGTGREVVLEGTGHEDRRNTTLLASRDWRYLVLLAQRESGERPKLHLIDTSDDSVTVMDEGDASFTLAGWSGHHFIYQVSRGNMEDWQPKKQAIKSYNARTLRITTLDETTAEGDGQHNFFAEEFNWQGPAVLGEEIVYAVGIRGSSEANMEGRQARLMSIKHDGSDKRVLRTFDSSQGALPTFVGMSLRVHKPNEVRFAMSGGNDLYRYANDRVDTVANEHASSLYNDSYPTYLVSPDGTRTFWSETRDGREAMFVGDTDGRTSHQVAVLADHNPYGWFTDDYLLVSKNGSELYIMDARQQDEPHLFKMSDYYRPGGSTSHGYGYGYGGL